MYCLVSLTVRTLTFPIQGISTKNKSALQANYLKGVLKTKEISLSFIVFNKRTILWYHRMYPQTDNSQNTPYLWGKGKLSECRDITCHSRDQPILRHKRFFSFPSLEKLLACSCTGKWCCPHHCKSRSKYQGLQAKTAFCPTSLTSTRNFPSSVLH